ncbi:MAG TPA: DUF5719 family protein, partial [Candidatus Dormibacteraeota bacterium]|nr:DUF5719 family protein [Candidatus Dormibacteraeota bacterium]
TYYFAEGFTGAGFGERLKLFVPNASGTAQITYYTQSGPINSSALITAGLVTTVDVNQAVGDSQQVSAKVVLPGPGVAERLLNYQFGTWKGSEDNVGTTQPATEWDFAEGSTLPVFSEFLTLQNPNATSVGATINYYTDTGAHPTKGLNLPPNSRTTIEVFKGDPTTSGSCDPAAGTCGVGPGIQGVSAKVTTPSGSPIIVERPFYVNGYSFGSGPINDGHDAFGAAAPATSWNFAEGTTEPGFNEYLTLENPQAATANVTLTYQLSSGSPVTKVLQLAAQSRATVQVFTGSMSSGGCTPSNNDCGLSGIVEGVSVHIASDQAIVAERPMYMVHDFGSGVVSGATVVVGSSTLGTEFGFAHASTVAGENDYLTIQNPGGQAATLTITYYGAGGQTPKTVLVGANQRSTVKVFDSASGVGPSQSELGIVIISDQPVLVEKPTYSTSGTGGATDSIGYGGAF